MNHRPTDRVALLLLGLYALDRAAKLAAVVHFFRRPVPPAPQQWSSVSVVHPITVGATSLRANLESRLRDGYQGTIEHIFVCDEWDEEALSICRAVIADMPTARARIVTVGGEGIAIKTVKIEAGLNAAHGDVVCFIDDDIALRSGAISTLVRYLLEPGAGAVFGLAAYCCWRDVPSSLMSLFVNTNALLSYVPLVYLAEPFTITGHCYALHRSTLNAAGTFRGMEGFVDDDHDLAQRVRRMGLRNVQTPLVYDVRNALPTMRAYRAQLKRWFVLPREALLPDMTAHEQRVSALGSAGNMLPGLLLALAVTTGRRTAWLSLGASITLAAGVHSLLDHRYVNAHMPRRRWLLLPLVVLVTPWQVVGALLSDRTIEWRGQRMRIGRGGAFVIDDQHTRMVLDDHQRATSTDERS